MPSVCPFKGDEHNSTDGNSEEIKIERNGSWNFGGMMTSIAGLSYVIETGG
jgi:hypothetical protein